MIYALDAVLHRKRSKTRTLLRHLACGGRRPAAMERQECFGLHYRLIRQSFNVKPAVSPGVRSAVCQARPFRSRFVIWTRYALDMEDGCFCKE